MFRRDRDRFRFNNWPHKFMGQRAPGSYRGFPRPPLPIGRELFQEIRDYMFLLIILEYPEGVTGYQLQEKYNIPRGSLIRTLQDLTEKNYIKTKEVIIQGRANKFYTITEKGKKLLEELKLRWTHLFSIMAEINPLEGMKMTILDKIEGFKTIDDAIDFFRGLRSFSNDMHIRIEQRMNRVKRSHEALNKVISEIENMDSLDKEKIRKIVKELVKNMENL